MIKYNTFIFDFDYTLADATPGIVKCVNYALEQAGLKSESTDNIRKTVGMALPEMFCELTGIDDDKMAEQFKSDFLKLADDIMTECTSLLPDTISILTQLKQHGYNTAIVSTKLRYRIDDALQKFGIQNLIDIIIGLEDVTVPKPSPEGLLKAIAFFKVEKSFVLYIGDSLIDANTAKNADVDFAAILTGTTKIEEFIKLPHKYITKNLTELLQSMENTE